jgi:SAM-dependent methyltransferase
VDRGTDFRIKPGYAEQPSPTYFVDTPTGIVYQPDVYTLAGALAHLGGARLLVDIGCGYGQKLMECARQYGLSPVGVDYGVNLAHCRATYPDGTWIEADLESAAGGIVPVDVLRPSVVVCSDVIEHLVDPTNLLRLLHECMRWARAGVLSTPERDLTRGRDHAGPPPNPTHVREWNARELVELLLGSGLAVTFVGLTRSDDHSNAMRTTLVILGPTP